MVVTIIGLSAVAFAPGIGRATTDRRVSTAARELIRIGRRARADTFGYLRAHLIWITPSTGVVQLLRGATNSCTLAVANWPDVQSDCAAPAVPGTSRCVENLSIPAITTGSTVVMYEETLVSNAPSYSNTALRALCYAPNGLVYWGTGTTITTATAALTDTNSSAVNGGFVYTLSKGPGAPLTSTRVHRVLFPLGGTARSLR